MLKWATEPPGLVDRHRCRIGHLRILHYLDASGSANAAHDHQRGEHLDLGQIPAELHNGLGSLGWAVWAGLSARSRSMVGAGSVGSVWVSWPKSLPMAMRTPGRLWWPHVRV